MAKQIFKILDDLSPSDMKLRNLSRKPDGLYNMHLNEYGQIVKRNGYCKYNTGDPISADHKIVGMHRFYKMDTASKEFLVACNEDIYKLAETTPWGATSIKSDLTADSDTYFYDFYNHCYILNGADRMMKYNLTNVRTVGIAIPAAPTLAAATPSSGNIDVGSAADDRGAWWTYSYTLVDRHNPANKSGKITSIEIYANTTMTGVKVATFYVVSGNNLSTRDAQSIGTVTAGSKQTFTVSLDVAEGDYLGIYFTDGKIEEGADTSDGFWYLRSPQIPCTNIPFTPYVNVIISLYGTGTYSEGGLANGVYKFKVTYVDEDGNEGNGSAPTAITLTGADDGVTVTIPIASDAKITKRRIYRTTVGGARYYYDGEVGDNSTTTYVSSQADATLSQGTVLHTDHTAPPDAPQFGTKRRSRAYIAKDKIFYVSNLTEPEYFPTVTGQYFWTGNLQKITGLLEQLTDLPVYTEDSIERLLGTDRDDFRIQNSYAKEGNIAIRSLVNCDNLLVYLGFDGIHYFDSVSTKIFSKALNEYIKTNINRTYQHLSCATYFNDKYLLCYPKGASTVPSETIYIDLKNRTYGIYSFDFSCFSRWDRGTDGLQLKGGSNTEGRVYSVFSGLDDDGSAITAYDSPEPIDLGVPEVYKQFYSVFVKIKSTSGTAFKFYYKLDNDADWTLISKTITANTTKWYRIGLGSGGKRARALKPRPYMSDKFYFEIQGYMLCFDLEAFAEEKE